MRCENTFDLLSGMCQGGRGERGLHNVQSASIMCECVFQAARGYLLISHARAFCLATPQRSIYRPSSRNYSYCPMLFLELVFFFFLFTNDRYTWGLLLRRSFYLSSIWHRIAWHRSIPFQCELNCPIALAIAYLLSCYLLSVFTLD